MKTESINLGDRVRDKITGFEGVVTARTEWLYGCVRVTVQPEKMKDGKTLESQNFDEPQMKILKRGAIQHMQPQQPRTYGPRDDAKALQR